LIDPTVATVCLLDDDSSVLKSVSRLVSSAGWNVKEFCDPNAFLLYAKAHRPSIAVIDVWMPMMNGLEVQSRLREISPATKVIIFTGREHPLLRSTTLNAAASAFFTKPFDGQQFLAAIRDALRD
jgi:two-component system, LuxR family, response regulator FixJ